MQTKYAEKEEYKIWHRWIKNWNNQIDFPNTKEVRSPLFEQQKF